MIKAKIAKNEMKRVLVDNRSLANIIFVFAFDQMEVDHLLTISSNTL